MSRRNDIKIKNITTDYFIVEIYVFNVSSLSIMSDILLLILSLMMFFSQNETANFSSFDQIENVVPISMHISTPFDNVVNLPN